jgi:hypothetical protein
MPTKYDPFSEYDHPQDVEHEKVVEVEATTIHDQPLQPKEQLLKNIDDMFDGADFVFDIANKFFKRLGGR